MFKKLFYSLVLCSFLGIGSITVYAESQVNVDEKINSIELNWDVEGTNYKIYKDGELVWEGADNTYIDSDVESSAYYDYKIGSFNESGDLLDIVTVTASPTKSKALQSSSDDDTTNSDVDIATVTTKIGNDFVELEWTELESDEGVYKVYRDEEKIAEVSNTQYKDTNLDSGKQYVYKIVAERKTSDENIDIINKEIEERNLSLNEEEYEELTTERDNLIKVVRTQEDISMNELQGLSTPFSTDVETNELEYSFVFRYTTFIPDRVVKNQYPLHGGWLKGDNRGFSATSNAYRSRTDVYAGWSPVGGSSGELFIEKDVGESVLYEDEAGTIVDRRGTASDSGIYFGSFTDTSNLKSWVVDHDVGVPFAAVYPNINYDYRGLINRGSYSGEIVGSHDKAPNHEMYLGVAYSDFGWTTIYRYTGGSFWNLVPGAPQENFSYSF